MDDDRKFEDLRTLLVDISKKLRAEDPEDMAHDIIIRVIVRSLGTDHTRGYWRTIVRHALWDEAQKNKFRDYGEMDFDSFPQTANDPDPDNKFLIDQLTRIAPVEMSILRSYYSMEKPAPKYRTQAFRARRSIKKKLRNTKRVWC